MAINRNTKQPAVISLTTVLVVSSVLLASGITLLLTAVDFRNANIGFEAHNQDILINRSCVETGLNQIKNNLNYTGSYNATFTNGSCAGQVSVDSQNGSYRNIAVTSISNSYYYTATYQYDVSQSPFVIKKIS